MKSFEEHSDGRVYIRSNDLLYIDTRENFAIDFGRATDPLQSGVIERLYVQGRRHALNGDEGTIAGGPMPYTLGDEAIELIIDLIDARQSRLKKAI